MEDNSKNLSEEVQKIIEEEQILIDANKTKYELISNFKKEDIFIANMINGDKKTEVVIKKISGISDDEEEAKHALRELSILSSVKHENIIKLLDVIIPEQENLDYLYLVTEKKPDNLKNIIKDPEFNYLKENEKKNYIRFIIHQILCALKYLHSRKIMHRDIKSSNILVDSKSSIFICDFGLARSFKDLNGQNEKLITKGIGTLFYVAPEMLGNEEFGGYNEKVDIWAVGCIMVELFTRKCPFFGYDKNSGIDNKNKKDSWNWFEQLKKIFSVFGMPEKDTIKKVFRNIEVYDNINNNNITQKDYPKKDFKEIFPKIKNENALDLLQKLFEFNYKKRISAEEALKHPFFRNKKLDEDDITKIEFGNNHELFFDYLKEGKEKNEEGELENEEGELVVQPINYRKKNIKEMQIDYCQKEIMEWYKKYK